MDIIASQCVLQSNAIADQVQISNLTDVSVSSWITGDASIVQDVFVCVYRNNSSGNTSTYGITATGDGPGFYLNGGGRQIPYSLEWNDGGASNPNGGTTAIMTNNVELSSRNNAGTTSADCNGGSIPTARLRLTVNASDMDAATDGTYNATITLLLSLT